MQVTSINMLKKITFSESIQTRFIIAVMIFFSLFFSHILRGNMSIAITSMAKKEESPIEMSPDVFIFI